MSSTRTAYRIHSWLGVAGGLWLLILALSGSFLVYRPELDRCLNPGLRHRPAALHPVSLDRVLRSAREAYPQYRVGYVMFPGDLHAPYVAYLREVSPDGAVTRHQVYVDAGTGAVVGHRLSYRFLCDWVLRLHECLWLPEFWGAPAVALLGVVLAALGLTGLWVCRRRLLAALLWRADPGRLGALHACSGVWSALFALLLGITGTVLNWDPLMEMFAQAGHIPTRGIGWNELDSLPPLDVLIARAHLAFPALEVHYAYFPESGPSARIKGVLKLTGTVPGAKLLGASSYVAFSADGQGRVLEAFDARQASLRRRLLFSVNALHFGTFAGGYSKIIYALGGLVVAFLSVSGLLIRFGAGR